MLVAHTALLLPTACAMLQPLLACAGDALGGVKLNHNPFSAIKQPSSDPTVERETDMAQLPSQPQAASGPATELTQDPDVDMLDTENQPDRQVPFTASAPVEREE